MGRKYFIKLIKRVCHELKLAVDDQGLIIDLFIKAESLVGLQGFHRSCVVAGLILYVANGSGRLFTTDLVAALCGVSNGCVNRVYNRLAKGVAY